MIDRPLVLVVDDDADHTTMLELLLDAAGYRTIAATSCAEGGAALAANDVDVLVSDFTLGDGTAIDLLRRAAHKPRVAIVLTGFDSDEDVRRTRAAGYDAHLVKPASIDALRHAIEAGLR
jgi:DNA-binding response OmpR family regulator